MQLFKCSFLLFLYVIVDIAWYSGVFSLYNLVSDLFLLLHVLAMAWHAEAGTKW